MLDTADIVINDSKTYGLYNWQTRPFYSIEFCLYIKDPYNPFLSLFQTVQSIPRQFPVQTTDFPVFHWIKKPRSTNSFCKDVAFYDSDVL